MTTGPIVRLTARPKGPKCPFGNDLVEITLRRGSTVWLSGASGLGKTTLSMFLAGLSSSSTTSKLDIHAECDWDTSIPTSERCGVLFQNTTLLDELTVAGNLCVALQAAAASHPHPSSTTTTTSTTSTTPTTKTTDELSSSLQDRIKALLEMVGLEYHRDANKRPSELSGGMARRASLALQLAQRKRVIVLDEPFTGLDPSAATSVARELVHLQQTHGTALLLISHEPHFAKILMEGCQNNNNNQNNNSTDGHSSHSQVVHLESPKKMTNGTSCSSDAKPIRPNLFGTTLFQRFLERLVDYVGWSLPLILLTFMACGLAIAMLSSDILRRIDVTDRVLTIVDDEVKPLLAMVNGGEVNSFHMMAVKMKVRGMLNATIPQAKAALYGMGMTKLFVLEIGPLLTALLLCGRIGGSYAGKVATMHATSETKLLRTLGIHPQLWTLVPSFSAALLASPILTAIGTAVAISLGAIVGPRYGIGNYSTYWEQCQESVFPELRLRSLAPLWQQQDNININAVTTTTTILTVLWDALMNHPQNMFLTPWSDSVLDGMIEIMTYPIVYHVMKSMTYISITMLTAEGCCYCFSGTRFRLPYIQQQEQQHHQELTPRHVPQVITSAVVLSSLLVIVADWGFSQVLLWRV